MGYQLCMLKWRLPAGREFGLSYYITTLTYKDTGPKVNIYSGMEMGMEEELVFFLYL